MCIPHDCLSSKRSIGTLSDLQKERGKAKQMLKSKMGANGLQKNLVTHLQMDDVESEQLVSKEAIEFPLVRQLFFVVVFHFNRFGASTYLLMMVFLHSGFTFQFYNLLIENFLLCATFSIVTD